MAFSGSARLLVNEMNISLTKAMGMPVKNRSTPTGNPLVLLYTRYNIRCYHKADDVFAEWPSAQKDAPGKLQTHTSPNYHIFQTTTFLKIWEQTYAPVLKAQLCLIEVRTEDGLPVIFLPLAIFKRNGVKILSFTDQGVADYNAPIIFSCGIEWTRLQAENLWQQIIKALPPFDFADFNNMPEKLGKLHNPLFLLANHNNGANSHATVLTHDWERIEQSLVRPKALRRKLRNLEKIGRCEFVVAQSDAERQNFLNFMLEAKQQRFIATQVPGFEQYPEKRHYFIAATQAFHDAGVLHFSALKLDGEIIATMWGLVSGPHYYGIMIASDLQGWAKYSPGHILHYLLLKDLKKQGYDCLDLGVGDEEWKLRNCNLTIPLMRMVLCNSLKGKIYYIRQRSMAALRATSLWQKIRPFKWRIIRFFQYK